MTQSDPEARIAQLERQLADARAAARPDNSVTQPLRLGATHATAWPGPGAHTRGSGYPKTFQSPRNRSGRNQFVLWIVALLPVFSVVAILLGLIGLIVALVVVAIVVVSHVALTRRGLDGETIIGGIIGVLGGVLGGLVAVVAVLVTQFPSSVMWMSAIVCGSPYHLEYDVSHYSVRPGEHFWTTDYACVSGENAYSVDVFAIWGLQGLLVALVLSPVAAAGFLVWRRLRVHR